MGHGRADDERTTAYVHGEDVTEMPDGTFTVRLSPWCDDPIEGIPTRKLALRIVAVAHAAMDEYGRECMTEG